MLSSRARITVKTPKKKINFSQNISVAFEEKNKYYTLLVAFQSALLQSYAQPQEKGLERFPVPVAHSPSASRGLADLVPSCTAVGSDAAVLPLKEGCLGLVTLLLSRFVPCSWLPVFALPPLMARTHCEVSPSLLRSHLRSMPFWKHLHKHAPDNTPLSHFSPLPVDQDTHRPSDGCGQYGSVGMTPAAG